MTMEVKLVGKYVISVVIIALWLKVMGIQVILNILKKDVFHMAVINLPFTIVMEMVFAVL